MYPLNSKLVWLTQKVVQLPVQETQETWVRSLGHKDPLEEEMATHSSILDWRIPWAEEPGGVQSMDSQRVRLDWATEHARIKEAFIPSFRKNLERVNSHKWRI